MRFEIRRYVLEGNTLLSPGTAERLLAPFTGADKELADVQRALEALESAYHGIGYGVVQVTLPEQNIARGEIRFAVVEARLGRVRIEGNTHFGSDNVRRSLPALVEGLPPSSHAIARNLQAANENPAKHTQVLLRSGADDTSVDAVVTVSDEKAWQAGVTLDNAGSEDSAKWRWGVSVRHANVLDRDHVLTAGYVASLGNAGDTQIYGASYRIALHGRSASIEIVGGYASVDAGVLQNLFTMTGAGTLFGLRYHHHLPRIADYEHRLAYGIDVRTYRDRVARAGRVHGPPAAEITVHPASVRYSGEWRAPGRALSFSLHAAQNIRAHGSDASDADFKAARPDARAAYRLYRYHAHLTQTLPGELEARLQWQGQRARDALVAGEQLGLGGADNVRGFTDREVRGDRGQRVSFELLSPHLRVLRSAPRAQLALFYDWGQVELNSPQSTDTARESISAAGAGVRLSSANRHALRVDMARVIQPGGHQERGNWKVHALLSALF